CFACSPKAGSELTKVKKNTSTIEQLDTLSITGTWSFTFETSQGSRTNKITIVQKGKKAIATNERGEFTMRIAKNKINWSNTRITPRGEVTINFNGRIVNQENMEGTMSASRGQGPGRQLNWTAVRLR
ncbi:MAG: hypothetical protein AAGA62_16900, partial [Bacteroidota bacterium]